ncbi:hypothetical protein HPB48_019750 [Haemaphysalis longicornis]|uniref:Uncharacterized protein n=1 Tax=Haemaphysalis longicornis TaxID=44386 RepID=A0A9J6FBZ8_HAELO|nr:hypothetical protein HPB48_019750 [Haemaphysalis longicornis]
MVSKRNVYAWLRLLVETTLYNFYLIKVDWNKFDRVGDLPPAAPTDEEEEEGEGDEQLERGGVLHDVDDPLQLARGMNASSKTMVLDDVVGVRQLLDGRHYLDIARGEPKVQISLVHDNHSEEFSFPQIYLGEARKVKLHPTPFAMASSEMRRADHREVEPTHVLYMAMKVMRHSLVENSITCRGNDAVLAITKQLLQ